MPAIYVELFGRRLVWRKAADSTEGALAPPEHIDEVGNLRLEHVFSLSFAHVGADGIIRRRRKAIGTVADLVILRRE